MADLSTNSEVVLTELEEGAVLLNLATRSYYSLNAAGLAVWRAIESGGDAPLSAAAEGLELDEDQSRASAARFVAELEREGLIEGSGGEAQAAGTPRSDAEVAAAEPQLLKHDEPLHEITKNPFDPQLPLAE
jgi:hypothetical protein